MYADFRERRTGEVRRTPLLDTSENKAESRTGLGQERWRVPHDVAPARSETAWGDYEDALVLEGDPVEVWTGLERLPVIGVRSGWQALVEHDVADVVLL